MRLKFNIKYFFWIVSLMIIGISSRKFGYLLPNFIAEFAPDAIWAMMVYFLFQTLFSNALRSAIWALLFSYLIEFSQLYQADWINRIRATTFGALVLGNSFVWTDLVCYSVGVLIAFLFDRYFSHKSTKI